DHRAGPPARVNKRQRLRQIEGGSNRLDRNSDSGAMAPAGIAMSVTGRLPVDADETVLVAVDIRRGCRGHPLRFPGRGQFEAVKIGLPPESLISSAHIFLIATTTPAGMGT